MIHRNMSKWDIFSVFISWVIDQRKAFDIHGITMLENGYAELLFEMKDWLMNPSPFPASYPIL